MLGITLMLTGVDCWYHGDTWILTTREMGVPTREMGVPLIIPEEPWEPADATNCIKDIAKDPHFSIAYKLHAKDRMSERNLIISDILYALRNGFVYATGRPCEKTNGYYKYMIESTTPNSGGRNIRLVCIPNAALKKIKLVTVMWVDEKDTAAGTI